MRRVVVTGMGLVTPLGCGVESVCEKIFAGHSGIRALVGPAYDKIPCRVAGIVPTSAEHGGVDLDKRFSESERRSSSKGILFALLAAEEAVLSSGLIKNGLSQEEREGVGVAVGMGMTDLQDVYDTGRTLVEKGYSRVSPYFIPRTLPNLAAGQISIKYGFQGPNHCASTACATGAHSIGDAFNFIRLNHADVMICGGAEASINPLTIAAFARLRALSTKFNDAPQLSSRPFDTDRDGFVMGEGAGILVLESLDHAKGRGARIQGEILGYGLTGDGHHMTAAREDGLGAFRAMKQVLTHARVKMSDVAYVNCHATSTPIGDKAEISALRKLFDSRNINNVPVSSTKGSLGHLLGAAGAVETIITLFGLGRRKIPPSINIKAVDGDFVGINIVQSCQPFRETNRLIALKNSFGFGGTNACLCISNFYEE